MSETVVTFLLQIPSFQVKNAILEVMKVILSRAVDFQEYIKREKADSSVLCNLCLESIYKLLPDIKSIINLRQVIIGSSTQKLDEEKQGQLSGW